MGGLRTSNQVSIQAFVFVLFSTFVQNKQKKYMFLSPSRIMTNNPGLNSLHFQLICQDFALQLQWRVKFFLLFISHQVLPPTSQHIVRKQSKGCVELVGHRFTRGNSTVSLFFLINGNGYNSKGNISEIILQSTLVISNSKGLSEILRDIRTSTCQICRIEENLIRLTTFNKYMCNLTPEVRDILKLLWKREAISPLFHNYFYLC